MRPRNGSEPTLRPATADDWRAFFGAPPAATVRAIVAELDGEILGIAGLMYERPFVKLFSDLKPEMRAYRKAIVRATRQVMEMARGVPAMAVADPGSERFLAKLGFEHIGRTPSGNIFRWHG